MNTVNKKLEYFENQLDPQRPEQSAMPCKVLGYGEITTVLDLGEKDRAFKRMPMFINEEEITNYKHIFHLYNEILTEKIGVKVAQSDLITLASSKYNNLVIYIAQEKFPSHAIGNKCLQRITKESTPEFIRLLLEQIYKVYKFNEENKGHLELGLDAQISNWAIILPGHSEEVSSFADASVFYIDTSSPLIRKNDEELCNAELFLRSAPSFLVWILRKFFLKDVLNRYYNVRLIMIDLIANVFKEQRTDLISTIISEVNHFCLEKNIFTEDQQINFSEVKSYYREDALIWRLYLMFRRVDRFLHRLSFRRYPYILPAHIKR